MPRHRPPPRPRADRERRGPGAGAPRVEPRPIQVPDHVAIPEVLARATVEIARRIEDGVIQENRRVDRSLSFELKSRRDLAKPDHLFISQAVFALFRWHGWIEPLRLATIEDRLLLSNLLDRATIHPVLRIWAKVAGRDPSRLNALGDAPTWSARAEGFRRILDGQPVTADPWRLFPNWLREHLPLPPGGASAKTRYVELLQAMQTRSPLWVRDQSREEGRLWDDLRQLGVKPWIHRKLPRSAKLDPDVDVYHLPMFEKGRMEVQDLASQAVGLVCDPDPGNRWWDCCAGAGGKTLHLAALMKQKGLVVATDVSAKKLKETVRRARRGGFSNVTTKEWDGKHVPGKSGSYHGVLVDAPCSAIGTWRRNPDARWTLDREAIPRLAATQSQILQNASAGVREGGTLVYSVCTLTPSETQGVIRNFLAANPKFQLDPFPHPLSGEATDGQVQIWPQDFDNDAMFIARMIRVS